ncbi:PNG1 [Candida theae]|uniref:Peptide:N-glycanase 1 n=1 Tax=Candida theae TaxID=1198502 RepID=A0AAD5BD11_9ASCO|nr:PNG1 [Candida theae]KAI5955395.1 PNG1 [Candida theae]
MSTDIDYSRLKDDLIIEYAKKRLIIEKKAAASNLSEVQRSMSLQMMKSIYTHLNCLESYENANSLDKALDAIDLAKIYESVDRREQEKTNTKLNYDDFVVLELLRYFKHDFFKWVNSPSCPCGSTDVSTVGVKRPDSANNPDQISIIEIHQCQKCHHQIEFPRINNPVSLLRTRTGRCGEWVNCFLLILTALIGEGKDRIRYVWNNEDHVWCEYYSSGLRRWVHLDPCEGVFDETLLYCDNWGKRMSYVIGFNKNSVVDLSKKYITKDKQIDQSSVADPSKVEKVITYYNVKKADDYLTQSKSIYSERESWKALYTDVFVPRNLERGELRTEEEATVSSDLPKGRQTGSVEWTKARGEDG